MLSSQTKDEVTYEAMKRLKNYGLEPSKIIEIQKNDLEKLIYPVSFYKVNKKNGNNLLNRKNLKTLLKQVKY